MTPTLHTEARPTASDRPAEPKPHAARPYAAPTLTPMGSVEVVTAGPDTGNLDQLIGSSGGFGADTTS